MNSTLHKQALSYLTLVAACSAALCASAGASFAQVNPSPGSSVTEQITITPPRFSIRRTPVSNAAQHGFAVAQATSISLPINYSDLDLSTPDGVKELQRRITATATGICRELNSRFPPDLYWSVTQFQPGRKFDCVQNAVKDAMAQAMASRRLAVASASP